MVRDVVEVTGFVTNQLPEEFKEDIIADVESMVSLIHDFSLREASKLQVDHERVYGYITYASFLKNYKEIEWDKAIGRAKKKFGLEELVF